MTTLNDIRTQLDQTAGVIEGFRSIVADGTPVDLAGLDENIATICAAIAKLPPHERPILKGALVTLMDEMNTLVASLELQRETTSQELKGVSSRQQAVSAYGKSGGGSRKGGPDK